MNRNRARRADKDLARAVALEVLGKQGVDRAPVDPFSIAESFGIVVQASDKLDGAFSGCLVQAGETFGILYSTGVRNRGYQRFTVAHELGHYSLTDHHRFLFAKGGLHRSESGFASAEWYEREADLFGVELLIPEFLFHRHRREFPAGLDGMKGLAGLFQASLTATGIRWATLCTESVAVVMSEEGRILYSVFSKPFAARFGVSARWESRGRPLPTESLSRRFNENRLGGNVLTEERGEVGANRWFPRASGELLEEVIGLGRYGKILTVLTSFG